MTENFSLLTKMQSKHFIVQKIFDDVYLAKCAYYGSNFKWLYNKEGKPKTVENDSICYDNKFRNL